MFRNGYAWILPTVWAILIFILSSIPDLSPDAVAVNLSDKTWHIIAYIPLGLFLSYAIRQKPGPLSGAPFVWALLIGSLYGVSDEIHQYFVPGRFMDGLDMLADAIGVILGAVTYSIYLRAIIRYRENIP